MNLKSLIFILFAILFLMVVISCEPDISPQIMGLEDSAVGSVWCGSASSVRNGSTLEVQIYANAQTQILAAYGIVLHFDSRILNVDTTLGQNGVSPGADGFVSSVNTNNAPLKPEDAFTFAAGFDAHGKGPGSELHLLTIHFNTVGRGTADLAVEVKNLNDEQANLIGEPIGEGCTMTVE